MKTITIKVDDRTKRGKTFIDMLEIFSKEREIEILETPQSKDKTAFLGALNLSEDEKFGLNQKEFADTKAKQAFSKLENVLSVIEKKEISGTVASMIAEKFRHRMLQK